MVKKSIWGIFILLAITNGIYPVIYFLIDRRFGLLGLKSDELLGNIFWNIGFYTHIIFGSFALLTGWILFSERFRKNFLHWHRNIGKVYVISVILASLGGIYIGLFATGGVIASTGFIGLGMFWFSTTLTAFLQIREKKMLNHQILMIFSYSACFANVTLKLWMPILTTFLGDFESAYIVVSWLCWVPNLLIASLICKRIQAKKQKLHIVPSIFLES